MYYINLLLFSALVFGDDGVPLLAAVQAVVDAFVPVPCWFFCDFPTFLVSGFTPCCLTFTPLIICLKEK